MNKRHVVSLFCASIMLVASLGTAHAALALQGRLPVTVGGTDFQAYYDPNLDITWAADADINGGYLNWNDALSWAAGVTIGAVDGWRLPSADVNGDGTVEFCVAGLAICQDTEMAFLYIEEGISTSTPGPFTNFIIQTLWTSTTHPTFFPSFARTFGFNSPDQSDGRDKSLPLAAAWAVHDGDVGLLSSGSTAVPVPSAVWLFGSGLLAIAGVMRRTV